MKRCRQKPNKKWSDAEVKLILNYMSETGNPEQPTAQIYYRELVKNTGLNSTWDLVRWKVRHLKKLFQKAKSLKESNLEDDDELQSLTGRVLQICPHFHQLNEIFGNQDESKFFMNNFESIYDQSTMQSEIGTVIPDIIDANNCNEDYEESNIADLEKMSKQTFYKLKLSWEKEKFIKTMLLEEKKLELEKEKICKEFEIKSRELDLKEKELLQTDNLAMMTLDRDERLKMYELKLKYSAVN